ncbi:MAG: hypothetical protein KDK78_04255 [Chlamydiia bacterium]|nr:hypothetical protein [Chlamydiia bacterium]
MNKLKVWNAYAEWADAEESWDKGAKQAHAIQPIKGLSRLPNMPGIAPETKRFLKLKSLWYILANDADWVIVKGVLRHPLRYLWNLSRSVWRGSAHRRDGDFYYYGVDGQSTFERIISDPDTLFVVGFSYCHKPFECPSERFTPDCIHDPDNLVCRQCFIGKMAHALPERNVIPLFVPTIHYIGAQLFDILHNNPGKRVAFLITTCEMILEMCGDIANMMGVVGIGVRLDGRVCNTMHALELSERGVKPGLTVVLDDTKEKMLALARLRRERCPDITMPLSDRDSDTTYETACL